jgi:hypothetical protein
MATRAEAAVVEPLGVPASGSEPRSLSSEMQFGDADTQHLGEPLQIARVRAFFAPLPSNSGSCRHSATKGQRILGQEVPLSKLANSVPRHLYGSVRARILNEHELFVLEGACSREADQQPQWAQALVARTSAFRCERRQ